MTTIVAISAAMRQANTYDFTAPSPIPADLRFARFTINLLESDKLSVGKSLSAAFFVSADNGATWQFVNGRSLPHDASNTEIPTPYWTSYGPGGFTVTDPDGTVRVNPDPRIDCPLAPHAGKLLRGVLTLHQNMRAGVTIEVQEL